MTNNENDEYIPQSQWKFNGEVTKVFQDMISRSIPGYEAMRELVFRMARNFVREGTNILDIGCSTGLSSERLIQSYGDKCNFILTDVSEPMLEKCRAKYAEEIKRGFVNVKYSDLRESFPITGCSIILSCLTIQFTPIEYRQNIIENVYRSLEPGGAFIFVEKVLGNSAMLDKCMIDEYYDIKKENAYTEEQIQTKRKSLEGALVPLTSDMDCLLLKQAGFKKIDCFWRFLNFTAFIAVK